MNSTDRSRPPLGWPWDQLADALLRWEAARQREFAAQAEGDVNATRRAELEREEAWEAFLALKRDLAMLWLGGLRAAIEYEPTALAELLGRLPAAETLVRAIQELEDRVDAAEDAVVNLLTK